ncbi:AMP-binding protein [Streptacidiphilus fuscans]|uniref:AMP-binding protein n=1 Tax=Streptacidiphilus fuscans TaxID=2789292 RepID=A0A931B5E9_9ACTN|nr:AMP-binding protein [Streptacidiphilus fuscans]MBF9068213.1 AMP-binding protein [Streptacidiphilus fuscans]
MNALVDAVLAQRGGERSALVGEGFRHSQDAVLRMACARAALLGERLAGAAYPHVGLLLENTPEYVCWLEAAALAGATVVGINPTRRGPDLLRDIRHTDCALLVTEQRLLPLLAGLDLAGRTVLVVDGPDFAATLLPYADAEPPRPLPAPDTRLLLTFTSGSTGAPKAVMCSQGRLARAGDKLRAQYGLTDADTGYACMPLFHGNALMGLWSPLLLAGGTIALRRRFSASHFLDDVREFGACYFTYVGRAVSYVLATDTRADDGDNPLRLGFGTEAGAVDARRFEQRFGCRLVEGYGSSEGGCNLRQDPAAPPGAVGRTGSGPNDDLAVVDPETGAECPPSRTDAAGRLLNGDEAIGELVNRNARAGFEGYWRNEEAGSARLRNGWYWTGDLFHRDADGWFHFAGRSADWLRVDSENLAVADIENILARWDPAVAVAVYAVPDPVAGDQVMAAVELRPDVFLGTGQEQLAASFARFLAAQPDLGTKMPPRFVRFVSRMPVTATHKTAKTGLRAERWDAVGADLVLWRPYERQTADAAPVYRRFEPSDREKVAALFAEHGRADVIRRDLGARNAVERKQVPEQG